MQHQLVISLSPIIANAGVLINQQGVNSKLLQSSSKRQSCLARAFN
jgi:hypothetical protein